MNSYFSYTNGREPQRQQVSSSWWVPLCTGRLVVSPGWQWPFHTCLLRKSPGNVRSRMFIFRSEKESEKKKYWLINTRNTFKDIMNLLFPETWFWWRQEHRGSSCVLDPPAIDLIFDLDWHPCGCLSSHHPSTLLSSHLSPDLLNMDRVMHSWDQPSHMMCSWRKERDCGKGANAHWLPTAMGWMSMDASSMLWGGLV